MNLWSVLVVCVLALIVDWVLVSRLGLKSWVSYVVTVVAFVAIAALAQLWTS